MRTTRSLVALVPVLALAACGGPGGGGGTDGGTPARCPTSTKAAAGLAITDLGAVKGHTEGSTYAFLGIPYAAPPVGDLRWKPPADAACLTGTLQANAFSSMCEQLDVNGHATGSEDCLYLNVWTPTGAKPGDKLPVLFFIHGGSNINGSASATVLGAQLYDGANLATAANAVVVTINYRLGPFGFYALPGLAAEDPNGSAGDYGILDQLKALEWVKANAAAFGGDPAHVLLFGESAGAIDTCAIYASPLGKGLFSAALMESGLCDGTPFDTLANREQWATSSLSQVGCDSASDPVACMRAVPASQIVEGLKPVGGIAGGDNFGVTIDGYVVPKMPLDALKAGEQNHVPFLMGTNADEGALFVGNVPNASTYEADVHFFFGQAAGDKVLQEYPATDYPSPKAAEIQVITDVAFTCPTRRALDAASQSQTEPVRRYFFTHVTSGTIQPTHGVELFYLFDHAKDVGITPTAGEQKIVTAMQQGWKNLASTGDPNGTGVPQWAPYTDAVRQTLVFDDPITTQVGVRESKCDFWDALGF